MLLWFCLRDDQGFENLLYNLRHYDIALKALVGDSELLIFTSAHLPEKHHSNSYHPKVLNGKLLHMFVLTTLILQDLRVNYIYGASSVEDKLLLNTYLMIVSFIIPGRHKLQMMWRIEVARNSPIRKNLVSLRVIKLVGFLLMLLTCVI